MLNFAKALRLGGEHVDAVHLDHHRVFPPPSPFLVPPVGQVTTADLPVDYLDGSVRLRAKIRLESEPTTTAILAMQRAAGASNISWDWYTDNLRRARSRVSTTGTGLILSTTPLPDGSLVPGGDQWIGVRWEQIGPGSVTAGEMSLDGGLSWADVTNVSRSGALDPFDSTAPITVGGLTSGATRFPGRIYWAEMMAIQRARLVFPGQTGELPFDPQRASSPGDRRHRDRGTRAAPHIRGVGHRDASCAREQVAGRHERSVVHDREGERAHRGVRVHNRR